MNKLTQVRSGARGRGSAGCRCGTLLALLCAAGLNVSISKASDAQDVQPVATPPVAPIPAPAPAREPTLDELLGIKDAASKPAERGTDVPEGGLDGGTGPVGEADRAKTELERKLAMQEIEDGFEQAVELMKSSALKLRQDRDAGVATQRMQEETLLKLDKLLDEARKQQKSKRKQKSSSQDQQEQDQKEEQQKQKQSSQGQQQAGQAQAGAQSGNPNNPMRSGSLNPPPGAGAAWGNLPQRLRDALMQGSGDYTSARWEALTREYYKRLAEEPVGAGANVSPANRRSPASDARDGNGGAAGNGGQP